MTMKYVLSLSIVAASLALAGCGPTFADDREELAYLQALSNPTPAQWKRRRAIEADMDRVRVEREIEGFKQRQRDREREAPARVAALMDRARDMESTAPLGAIGAYEEIIEKYPDRPEATTAAGRIRTLEARGRAEDAD